MISSIYNNMNDLKKVSDVISRKQALAWLKDKCKELNLSSIDELEFYGKTTEDKSLAKSIEMYIILSLN